MAATTPVPTDVKRQGRSRRGSIFGTLQVKVHPVLRQILFFAAGPIQMQSASYVSLYIHAKIATVLHYPVGLILWGRQSRLRTRSEL